MPNQIDKLSTPDWPEPLRGLPNNRMRSFVLRYVRCQNAARASREAGYLPADATALDHAQRGYELLQRPDVIEAILALTKLQLRSLAPAAIAALKELIEQPGRDAARVRAITTVLERTDAAVQKVEHTHHFDPIRVTLDEIVRLRSAGATREAIMLALGFQSEFEMSHYENLLAQEKPIIDVEYEEVSDPGRDPDAELLGE
jgi:phage terminase small subunit